MEIEERLGLRKHHTYDEIVAWLGSNPKGVPYPNRVAAKTFNSPVYGQLRDSLRTFTEAKDAYSAYQRGEELGPFVPPRPRFVEPPAGGPPPPPPDDDDDDLMGPAPGPERYTTLLEPAPRSSDQVLLNEGMQPPAPPPPPPPPSMVQQAGDSFARAAGDAAGGVVGAAAGQAATAGVTSLMTRAAAAAGVGAAFGAEAGPAGVMGGAALGAMSALIGSSVGEAVRRGFQPGGGSSAQPSGPPTVYGPGGFQSRVQPRNQEAINRQQRLHNQGTGTPAAQVDFRTLNGENDGVKPRDRRVHFGGGSSSRVGVLGGAPSSSSEPMSISGSGTSRPAAPMDPGGAKIPRNADPAPMATPSYKDLVGKLKGQKAAEVGPITPSRPRERSPPRGDRRPLDAQRRPKKDSSALFPGGDGREEALARRSKTIPGPPEFYIGDQGTKRPATKQISRSTKPPNPAAVNPKFASRKRKAEGPPDTDIAQDRRRPPPRPARLSKTTYSKEELKKGRRKRGSK